MSSFAHLSRRLWLLVPVGALSWNCSAADGWEDDSGADGDADLGAPSDDGSSIDIRPGGAGGAGPGESLSALCGAGACVPDDLSGCEGGAAGLGGEGGQGELGPRGDSCQLVVDCQGEGCTTSRECAASGSGVRGAPCFASSDCEAGMACVGDSATGSCQPYCCRGTQASCGESDFCGARPLVGSGGTLVPVCLPTE
ncbi:MAG TPA: hypothetical protein VLC09_19590, partial [Polyangiaceae bacterium]|nr:hypothetical protein [Polyangiaceae bacterium]